MDSVLYQIQNGKPKLTTYESKRLPEAPQNYSITEILSSYSFNLYYVKGKDMILSNFLCRQKHDDSNPHEIIPISFHIQNISQTRYYNIGERKQGKYLVQTRSQAETSDKTLPEIHGVHKGIDLNIRLGKQVVKPIISSEVKGVSQTKPILGQGKAGIK